MTNDFKIAKVVDLLKLAVKALASVTVTSITKVAWFESRPLQCSITLQADMMERFPR